MKKRISLSVLLLAPLVLSGCLVISSLVGSQLNTVGNVRVVLEACFSQSAATASCTNTGNAATIADATGGAATPQQPMIAFRIPDTATAPSGFTTTAGVPLTFASSTQYTQALQTLAPAPAGQHWAGYMATTAIDVNDGANQSLTVSPEFALQRSADGSPFTGPFLYRPVVGDREITSTLTILRTLDCGTSLFATNSSPGDTICIDSPSAADTVTNLTQSTRDLGVLASAPVVGTRGSAAAVPFVLKYAGSADPSANFSVDASTNLPGATATPSQGSLLPATDSSNPVNVSVNVPAGAPAGTYDVILNARLASGEVRTNTGKLKIPDTTKPTVTITLVNGQKTGTVLKKGLKLKVKMSEAGTVALKLTTKLGKTRTLSSKSVSYTGAGTKQVTLTVKKGALSPAMRTRMLSLSKVKLTLRASAKDTAGNTRAVTKTISLKR
jgi:hypothetical protein